MIASEDACGLASTDGVSDCAEALAFGPDRCAMTEPISPEVPITGVVGATGIDVADTNCLG